jgi:LysR family transcriptional regulator, cyn operon transcriptional activator
MELRHLRYFVAVAEAENVSRAAARVRISQPALSRQIHDLEAELGVALFERAGRTLRLTGAGEDLLAHGRKVLNEAEAFRERARALHRGDVGVLHVGATPQTLQRLFPAVLERFRELLPSVDVRLAEGHPAALLDLLRRGELHLAFTVYQPELRTACRPAGVAPLLVVSNGKRRVGRKTVEVRALEDVPLLLLQRGFGTRDLFDAACQVAHIRPTIFLESSAPATLLSLAQAGSGVAILPATVALPRTGVQVQRLLQDGKPLVARLAVHWNPQRHLPPYAERFAEVLAAHSRTLYAGSPR